MQRFITGMRIWIILIVAIVGSTIGYWRHARRAVGVGGLCQNVERHVAKLGMDENGAIREDAIGLVENIQDLCEQRFSRSQAECVLKADTLAGVRSCSP